MEVNRESTGGHYLHKTWKLVSGEDFSLEELDENFHSPRQGVLGECQPGGGLLIGLVFDMFIYGSMGKPFNPSKPWNPCDD